MEHTEEGEFAECPKDLSNYEIVKNLVRSVVFMKLDL